MADRVGTFRRELTPSEIARVVAELGPLASKLGYSIGEPN